MEKSNLDVSNVDLLQHLNTKSDVPATIDTYGNVIRRGISFDEARVVHPLNSHATALRSLALTNSE